MAVSTKISIRDFTASYGKNIILNSVSADFQELSIAAITGPSGQGKSTLLTSINRLNDEIPGAGCRGEIRIRLESGEVNVYRDKYYLPMLRRKVGLVFQKPNPLPVSILKNVALPLNLSGGLKRSEIRDRCEQALKQAFLWEETRDRLDRSALELSGGQQQRLCIARALVLEPEVLMLDEPTSSLDTEAAGQIEDMLLAIKEHCTVLVVSHYLEQVNRIADETYRISAGKLTRV